MSNNNRTRGDYLERQTKRALEAEGWAATRAAGSHGVWDVMAVHKRHVPVLVSCKSTGVPVSPAERRALVDAASAVGASPLLATRVRRGWITFYRVHVEGIGSIVHTLRVPDTKR
jgi:Holliday junction resolvase